MIVSIRARLVAEKCVFAVFRVNADAAQRVHCDLDRWCLTSQDEMDGYTVDACLEFRHLLALSLLKLFVERPLYTVFGLVCALALLLTLSYKLVV